MMVVGKNEATRSILRKGFETIPGGDDHIHFGYIVDGEPIVRTYVSHGPDYDLTPYLLGKMAKQCHLSRQQFIAFAKCQMTEEQYRQILIDKGVIKE